MTTIKRKLTKQELDEVFHIANGYYRELSVGTLDDKQFRSRCFVEAVCTVLNIQGIEYPERNNCEPVED